MNRALFLDRDEAINVEKGYVYRIEDFEFTSGVFELCTTAQDFGFVPIVITNHAGIGSGYHTEADFQRLTAWMLEHVAARGIRIGRVCHCLCQPASGDAPTSRACVASVSPITLRISSL